MPDDQFNALAEFRKRYPSSNLSDQDVYRGLANPDNFRAAFPEFAHVDNTTIGRNVAAEAGQVTDTGKPWYKQAWEGVAGIGNQIKENIMTGGKSGQMATLNANKQLLADAAARKAEGRSLPYRAAANTMEGLGLFNPRPMEEAANAGHSGEVVGNAVAAAAPYVAPLAIEGAVGAGRAIRTAAMEEPVVARQRAMNVAPKSKQAIRAEKEGTAAAPYLKGATDLKDVQARIPAAKQEIFQPYMDAVDRHTATGQTLNGPDGNPVTANELEDLRQQTSAQLQSTRKMQPTEQWTAVQKGQAIKDLTDRYAQITSELDPAIKSQGIDPKRTRAAFGAVKGVEKRFEGRSTLLENKPSGLQKMAGVDITKPETLVGAPASGARDIVAGRGWWNQKPTDVQVREGFRTAGPKPDLTVQPQPPARGLPPGPLVTPPPGTIPPSGTPPAVAATSRAQRLGLILPENVPVRPELPAGHTEPTAPGTVHYGEAPPAAPATATEPPSGQTPNRRIVRDPATGRMKVQYLTSSGGEIVRDVPAAKEAVTPLQRDPKTGRMLPRGQAVAKTEISSKDFPVNEADYWSRKLGGNKLEVERPKISTDSMGVKWAKIEGKTPVSIPKNIPESEIVQYAKAEIDKQQTMQGKGDVGKVKMAAAQEPIATKSVPQDIAQGSITDIRAKGLEARKSAAPKTDYLSDYQKRIEERFKQAGISPEQVNRSVSKQIVQEQSPIVQKPTGIPLVDVQREINSHGLSDVVTPTEARGLSAQFQTERYKNMTPLMKRRFIIENLTYGKPVEASVSSPAKASGSKVESPLSQTVKPAIEPSTVKPIQSITDIIKNHFKKSFVKDPQAGVLRVGKKEIKGVSDIRKLRLSESTLNDENWFNKRTGPLHITKQENLKSIEKNGLRPSEGGLRGSGVYFGNSFGGALSDSWTQDAQLMDGSHAAIRIKPSATKLYKLNDTDHGLVSDKVIKPEHLEYTNDGRVWKPLKGGK